MSAPSDIEEPGRVWRASDSSRTLASFIRAYHDDRKSLRQPCHTSTDSSAMSTTLTLVDASMQTDRISKAATQTQRDGEKLPTEELASSGPQASSQPPKVAPRFGLFAKVCFLDEAENPKAYSNKIKWFITLTVALAAAAAPLGSAIIFPALKDISTHLHTQPTIANLSVALYMLSMSIFPLWWSSFSETSGRRAVYLVSFLTCVVWNVFAAESSSIGMFIAMRILGGGSSAAVQAVGAGTIADIWDPKDRGRAMGIFYLGPLLGPLLAPIIGGSLTAGLGWRSTQWFLAIYGGLLFFFILFFLPETHAPKPSMTQERYTQRPGSRLSQARRMSVQSVRSKTLKFTVGLRRFFLDPLKIIKYFRFPAVALTVFYASMTFGALMFLNISIEKTFSVAPYNFSPIIIGCLYIFNAVGYVLASVLGGPWIDRVMRRRATQAGRFDEHGKLTCRPLDRLGENIWIAAFIMPAALIWYGWCADFHFHWAACMTSGFFFGIGSLLIFNTATTMLTEFMPGKASHGVALNNLVRNVFSCVGALAAEPAINGIGNGWLFTTIAMIALLSIGCILAMKRWGEQWREEMEKEFR